MEGSAVGEAAAAASSSKDSEGWEAMPEFDTWDDWRLIKRPFSMPPVAPKDVEGTGRPRLST